MTDILQGYVLDASAVLALLNQEVGANKVEQALLLPNTCMSSVQLAEVVAKLIAVGVPIYKAREIMQMLAVSIVSLDEEIALKSAELMPVAKPLGLSLGDRACLATSIVLKLPALTADKVWLQVPNVLVESIR